MCILDRLGTMATVSQTSGAVRTYCRSKICTVPSSAFYLDPEIESGIFNHGQNNGKTAIKK